jgi:hypothetical protein
LSHRRKSAKANPGVENRSPVLFVDAITSQITGMRK